jgi:hypothetical protein
MHLGVCDAEPVRFVQGKLRETSLYHPGLHDGGKAGWNLDAGGAIAMSADSEIGKLLLCLRANQRRGSKPRCHVLTHGSRDDVAKRLNLLMEPWGHVSPDTDHWMPEGFVAVDEAQLGTSTLLIPSEKQRQDLLDWWLAVPENANTPNWDVASTCIINGKPGLLLVEAKAHDAELRNEEKGKELKPPVSINSRRNHMRIGACMQDANLALAGETHLPWALSRDWNYQMSNRFAWAWKLTSLGIPIVLVYLGFLLAEEMRTNKQTPFATPKEWEQHVRSHSEPLFPAEIWNQKWTLHGQCFIPIIKTLDLPIATHNRAFKCRDSSLDSE